MGALTGFWKGSHLIEIHKSAMKLGFVPGPDFFDGSQLFFQEPETRPVDHAMVRHFRLEPASAHAKNETSFRENVEGCGFFGKQDWVMLDHKRNAACDFDVFGHACGKSHGGEDIVGLPVICR